MFESHFGFSTAPFQLSPDPSFYFASRGHGHALSYMKYGVYQGEGFIVVTGEIGSGKTTLVRTLLSELDSRNIVAAQVVSTQLDARELLHAICTAFGLQAHGPSKADALATLEVFFTALAAGGRRALLIVDEAQNLGLQEAEELRMLSNFQLGAHALVQSFLIGQPELRTMIRSRELEQLRQRVIASCHLGPLGPDETRAYIEHRLRRVGWQGHPGITTSAFERIHTLSGGLPRRINLLCTRALVAAWLAAGSTIDEGDVVHAATELDDEPGGSSVSEGISTA